MNDPNIEVVITGDDTAHCFKLVFHAKPDTPEDGGLRLLLGSLICSSAFLGCPSTAPIKVSRTGAGVLGGVGEGSAGRNH